jgi:exodeoxyribonuclease VII large subunit
MMNDALREQVEDMKDDVSSLSEELHEAMKDKLDFLAREVKSRKDQLEALNPKQVLSRGYSISMNEKGQVIASVKDVKPGEKIKTSLKDGNITSTIESVED